MTSFLFNYLISGDRILRLHLDGCLFSWYIFLETFLSYFLQCFVIFYNFTWIKEKDTSVVLYDKLYFRVFFSSHSSGTCNTCRSIEVGFELILLFFFWLNLFFFMFIRFLIESLISILGYNLFGIIRWCSTALIAHYCFLILI